jgi:hypothetical protein
MIQANVWVGGFPLLEMIVVLGEHPHNLPFLHICPCLEPRGILPLC